METTTTVFNPAETSVFTEEFEAREASLLEKEYRPEMISEGELIHTFGTEAKKIINEKISEYEWEIIELNSGYQKSLVRLMSQPEMVTDKETAEIAAFITWAAFFEKEIKRHEKNLKRLIRLRGVAGRKNSPVGITQEDVMRAKETPIETYIQFDRAGFTRCIWHNEKSGSMKLYRKTNRVYCYGCNKGGDVVDVIMNINDTDFISAVKYLLGK